MKRCFSCKTEVADTTVACSKCGSHIQVRLDFDLNRGITSSKREELEYLLVRLDGDRDFAKVTVTRCGDNLLRWRPYLTDEEIAHAVIVARSFLSEREKENQRGLGAGALNTAIKEVTKSFQPAQINLQPQPPTILRVCCDCGIELPSDVEVVRLFNRIWCKRCSEKGDPEIPWWIFSAVLLPCIFGVAYKLLKLNEVISGFDQYNEERLVPWLFLVSALFGWLPYKLTKITKWACKASRKEWGNFAKQAKIIVMLSPLSLPATILGGVIGIGLFTLYRIWPVLSLFSDDTLYKGNGVIIHSAGKGVFTLILSIVLSLMWISVPTIVGITLFVYVLKYEPIHHLAVRLYPESKHTMAKEVHETFYLIVRWSAFLAAASAIVTLKIWGE